MTEPNARPFLWLWCDVEQAPSTATVSGRCSSCGAADHLTLEEAQAAERAERDEERRP